MNLIMRTKIETCLELAKTAEDFKDMVIKVTEMSPARFKDIGLTNVTYTRLLKGDKPADILREIF